MPDANAPLRPGDRAIAMPAGTDAGLHFIGRIRTPFATLDQCPKQGRGRDILATVELSQPWHVAVKDLELFSHIYLLYWFEHSRRDLVLQTPGGLPEPRGTFALRSPVRPNPIGLHVSELLAIDGGTLKIRGIDCLDRTPLLDIKPYFPADDAAPAAKAPARSRSR